MICRRISIRATATFDLYVAGVGLPWRAPPIAPAHVDRQLEFGDAA